MEPKTATNGAQEDTPSMMGPQHAEQALNAPEKTPVATETHQHPDSPGSSDGPQTDDWGRAVNSRRSDFLNLPQELLGKFVLQTPSPDLVQEAKELMTKRRGFQKEILGPSNIHEDPYEQLNVWIEDARVARCMDADALTLSTATPDGRPNSRTICLQSSTKAGLVFYTNGCSRKVQELEVNPHCCLNFWWHEIERSVRIIGVASKVPREEAASYWESIRQSSKLGAHFEQSQPISDREALIRRRDEITAQLLGQLRDGESVPYTERFCGYRVKPTEFEFWQGQKDRLHDRIVYTLEGDSWQIKRLVP